MFSSKEVSALAGLVGDGGSAAVPGTPPAPPPPLPRPRPQPRPNPRCHSPLPGDLL